MYIQRYFFYIYVKRKKGIEYIDYTPHCEHISKNDANLSVMYVSEHTAHKRMINIDIYIYQPRRRNSTDYIYCEGTISTQYVFICQP